MGAQVHHSPQSPAPLSRDGRVAHLREYLTNEREGAPPNALFVGWAKVVTLRFVTIAEGPVGAIRFVELWCVHQVLFPTFCKNRKEWGTRPPSFTLPDNKNRVVWATHSARFETLKPVKL